MIDDDDINCHVPALAPAQSSVNVFYCHTLISFARFASHVAKKLSSVQAFRQGSETLVKTVSELDEQLTILEKSIGPPFCRGAPVDNSSSLPHGMTLQQTIYVRYAYFGVLFDLHTTLTCPWILDILDSTQQPALRCQIEKSNLIVVQSCRDAILATKHVHIDASTPLL